MCIWSVARILWLSNWKPIKNSREWCTPKAISMIKVNRALSHQNKNVAHEIYRCDSHSSSAIRNTMVAFSVTQLSFKMIQVREESHTFLPSFNNYKLIFQYKTIIFNWSRPHLWSVVTCSNWSLTKNKIRTKIERKISDISVSLRKTGFNFFLLQLTRTSHEW